MKCFFIIWRHQQIIFFFFVLSQALFIHQRFKSTFFIAGATIAFFSLLFLWMFVLINNSTKSSSWLLEKVNRIRCLTVQMVELSCFFLTMCHESMKFRFCLEHFYTLVTVNCLKILDNIPQNFKVHFNLWFQCRKNCICKENKFKASAFWILLIILQLQKVLSSEVRRKIDGRCSESLGKSIGKIRRFM